MQLYKLGTELEISLIKKDLKGLMDIKLNVGQVCAIATMRDNHTRQRGALIPVQPAGRGK